MAFAIGILIPGTVLAGGHRHSGHGGHGRHGHGHGSGWGHTNFSFSLGFGHYGREPYYSYPYYSPYYYPSYDSSYSYVPGVVYVVPPAAPPVAKPARASDPDMDKYLRDLKKARFWDYLQQGDKAQRLQAINQLAGFSNDEQVRIEFESILLSDPDAEIRKAVAVALGEIKNQKSIGVLEKVRVGDSDLEVRKAADIAIDQIKS